MADWRATDPKEELLYALTHHVRVLTVDQVARTWWSHTQRPRSNARKQLRSLEERGMVQLVSVMARPEIELAGPCYTWRPGGPEPDFGPIAYRLRARWTDPFVPTQMVIATREAKGRLGGYIGGRKPRDSEATHDVHLAQLYLLVRDERPELLEGWVSEAQQYAEGGGKNDRLPDVIIRQGGRENLLLEFAGAYSKQKLQAFHADQKQFPYELW